MNARIAAGIAASLEQIEFRANPRLLPGIALIITRLMGTTESEEIDRIAKELAEYIGKEMGLSNVSVKATETIAEFSVEIQHLSKSHPLIYRSQKRILASNHGEKFLLDYNGLIKGGVDRRKGVVYGDFRSVPVILNLPIYAFSKAPLTADEWAECIAHELGHVFAYFEFVTVSVLTNVQLADVANVWMGHNTRYSRSEILKAIEDSYDSKFDNFDQMVQDDDALRVATAVNAMAAFKHRHELGCKHYDSRTYEFVADQFVARLGGGRNLVTGMDKLYRNRLLPAAKGYHPTMLGVLSNLSVVALPLMGALMAGPFGAVVGGMAVGWRIVGQSAFTTAISRLEGHGTVDAPAERYAAIRREIVNDLKDQKLSKEYVAKRLADLDEIDKTIASLKDAPRFYQVVANFIAGVFTGSNREYRANKQYEQLANNELFVKAQQLKQLG